MHLYKHYHQQPFPKNHANLSISFFFPSPLSLRRCKRTELMRFLPGMPLTQRHRDPVPTTGWILALALLLALQVIWSKKMAISVWAELPRVFFIIIIICFSFPLFSFNLLFLADMFINCLWAQIQSNYILASLCITEKWWFRLPPFFLHLHAFIEPWLIYLGIILNIGKHCVLNEDNRNDVLTFVFLSKHALFLKSIFANWEGCQ